MKKIMSFSMAALVAMGAILASCAKSEVAGPEPEIEKEQEPGTEIKDNILTVTTIIGRGENDATKALSIDYEAKTLTKTFADDDQVALVYENTSDQLVKAVATAENISGDGKSANFSFTMVNPKADQTVYYYYPAALVNESAQLAIPIETQDGTLSNVESLDYAYNIGIMSESELPASVKLENKFAIVAFTLKDETSANDITSTITGMTISDGIDTYRITRPAAAGPIYVVMRPIADKPLTITATGGGKNYTKSVTAKTYSANNFYQQGLRMAEAAAYKLLSAATAEDIGKVVCAAGHLHDARTAVPAGCTAVGILGKVTETGIGLILALKDATAQTWDTINRWTSETYYAGTTLKLLPDDAARGTNLTSYTVLGTTAVSNWAVAQKSDYAEIFTNLGSTTGNSEGKTYDANVNAYITTGIGGAAISGSCWSATEYDGGNEWAFNSVWWGYSEKTTRLSVRPVLGFGAAKPLSAATAEDVGKVVCAAGHLHPAKTALPTGSTAVGILGKVTETGHGLILALQDATSQQWSTINGWTSVTTYDHTKLRLLPDDTARGSLTSYTTLGSTAVSNWCVAQKSDYAAICTNLGSTTGDDDGKTYDGNVNAYITTGVGGTALDYVYWYWSATEYNNERGWVLKSNYWDDRPKDNWFRVRPVLAFYPFNHLPIYY